MKDDFAELLFFTSGRSNFSQIHEGMTNIFLINDRYRRENPVKTWDGEPLFDDKYLDGHQQTYWLKYLILMLIRQTNSNKSNIINIFSKCKINEGYKINLIRLILFSLAEVKHGRLIKPSTSFGGKGKVHVSGIRCTPRGSRLIEENLFWTFDYLSLVVEDEWLEVPIMLANEFKDPVGYGFLFSESNAEFKRKYAVFLEEKAKNVFIFLLILEISLEFEKRSYPSIFLKLMDQDITFPDFSKIRQKVAEDILSKIEGFGQEDGNKILDAIEKYSGFTYRQIVGKKLRAVFSKAYSGN